MTPTHFPHCWHKGPGTVTGETRTVPLTCCRCGATDTVTGQRVLKPLDGHGQHYTEAQWEDAAVPNAGCPARPIPDGYLAKHAPGRRLVQPVAAMPRLRRVR